jgi:hypothetical protein
MNSVFALIACPKGNLEEKETGTSEVIFKDSGLVAPIAQIPNSFFDGLIRLEKLVA